MSEAEREDGHDGVFVVFEGIDGAGTSTQSAKYAELLRSQRRMVHLTREPSPGPVGSLIRMVLGQRLLLPPTHHAATMALLFAADRLDHVQVEVEPNLRDSGVVISDRYDLSSLAYQSATAMDPDNPTTVSWIRELNRFARRPDATVILNVEPEVAAKRRMIRSGPAELFDDAELQASLAKAYANAEELVPGDRVLHIDGNGTVDEVFTAIVDALQPIVKSS